MDHDQVRARLAQFGSVADDWFALRPAARADRFTLTDHAGATADVVVTDRYVEIVGRRALDPADDWQADRSSVAGRLVRTEVHDASPPTLIVSGRVYVDGFSLHTFLVTASHVLALIGPAPAAAESAPDVESPALPEQSGVVPVTQPVESAPHDAAREPVEGSTPLADALMPVQVPTFDQSPSADAAQSSSSTATAEPSQDEPPAAPPDAPAASPSWRSADVPLSNVGPMSAAPKESPRPSDPPSHLEMEQPDAQAADQIDARSGRVAVTPTGPVPSQQAVEDSADTPRPDAAPAAPPPEVDDSPQPLAERDQPERMTAPPLAGAASSPERLVSETIRIPRSELLGPPAPSALEPMPPPAALEAMPGAPASDAPASPRRCASCGATVQVGERFCMNCGTRQELPAPTSERTTTTPPESERTHPSSGSPWQRRGSTEVTCRRCGHANPFDSRHCESCGAPFGFESAPPAAPALVTCPNCRFVNRPTNRFCQGCGQPL